MPSSINRFARTWAKWIHNISPFDLQKKKKNANNFIFLFIWLYHLDISILLIGKFILQKCKKLHWMPLELIRTSKNTSTRLKISENIKIHFWMGFCIFPYFSICRFLKHLANSAYRKWRINDIFKLTEFNYNYFVSKLKYLRNFKIGNLKKYLLCF